MNAVAHCHGVGPVRRQRPDDPRERLGLPPAASRTTARSSWRFCSLGLDAPPTTEVQSRSTRYDEENVMYPLKMSNTLCIDFR